MRCLFAPRFAPFSGRYSITLEKSLSLSISTLELVIFCHDSNSSMPKPSFSHKTAQRNIFEIPGFLAIEKNLPTILFNATGKLPAFKNSMRFRNTCIEGLRGVKKSACWQKFTRASLTISGIDVSCSATPR